MRKIMILSVLLPVMLAAQADLLNTPPVFVPRAKAEKLPQPFICLDSILNDLYQQAGQTESVGKIVHDMDDEKLMELARVMVQVSLYPSIMHLNLLYKENKPWHERTKILNQRKNKNLPYLKQPKPGALQSYIKKVIKERLPWEWKFHLENKYILYVHVNLADRKVIGKSGKVPYYRVHIIDDIKGNFHYGQNIELVSNYVRGRMTEGKNYIVFLLMKRTKGPEYMIRGLATEGYGFLPVENGFIIDRENVLRLGKERISLSTFKRSIKSFLNKVGGR
ncbi:MAG TPA: hypothetical protein ENJ10_04975 [Caldithrix abyssi]|uniref:Uncharacterized protein n=1 Tax=Caldithrix abyssi TaxID=187145 RepID=A0A7V1PTU7_CALAY|nr:hypothetical protein [Caldithrix abyssi]